MITDVQAVERLKTEWDRLAAVQISYRPFLCFDWFKIWFEHFLRSDNLLILLLYKNEQLVTIAPFIIREEKSKGVKTKRIELAGNVYSPIRYFILSPYNDAPACISTILEFFKVKYNEWDIIDFSSIPEEHAAFDMLLHEIAKTGLHYSDYFCFWNMYLDEIDYSGEEYLRRRPGNISKNVPYRMRRLQRLGELEIKLITDSDDIDHYMDIYYELYSRSWQKEEHVGPTFHRSFVKMAAENCWLRLGYLFFKEVPIASQLWISADRYAYIVKLFYDEQYQQYAPGKILSAEMAKWIIDTDNVRVIDYLHGDESYKKDWTPLRRGRKGITVYNSNSKGQYMALLNKKILPVLNKYPLLKEAKEMIARKLR
jgi:hypothetical protein